jgi:hypothetical protein
MNVYRLEDDHETNLYSSRDARKATLFTKHAGLDIAYALF